MLMKRIRNGWYVLLALLLLLVSCGKVPEEVKSMPEGLNAGNIALNLTLNKDGFNRDLGNMQQTAAGIGKSIASSLGGAANSALGLGRKFVSASTTADIRSSTIRFAVITSRPTISSRL